ncbi:MAG: GNAT family N-acetyltransferase [Clostridia bacterium]|nr:GNAT family N-acetyltransferase [Clostridia bacterium]
MKLIKHYKNNPILRKSLSQLATETFGLEFETLFEKGYWDDRFSGYALVENDEIVANVCFHELTLLRYGVTYEVLQIGTVMTQHEYRKKGLQRQLMEAVLEDYKDKDAFYLFANDSVKDFYPLFGFEPKEKIIFELNKNLPAYEPIPYQKITVNENLPLLYYHVLKRVRNHRDEVLHDDYLKMFYMMYVFDEAVYLVKDTIVVCEKLSDTLHVYDVFMTENASILDALKPFMENIKKIRFHFEPEISGLNCEVDPEGELFVKTEVFDLKQPWSYPTTSIT